MDFDIELKVPPPPFIPRYQGDTPTTINGKKLASAVFERAARKRSKPRFHLSISVDTSGFASVAREFSALSATMAALTEKSNAFSRECEEVANQRSLLSDRAELKALRLQEGIKILIADKENKL